MRNKFNQMIKDFKEFGVELSDHQLEQFNTYYDLLIECQFYEFNSNNRF